MLNWFSPLRPARTEIANYTDRLLPYLAEKTEVNLWTAQEKWSVSDERVSVHHYSVSPLLDSNSSCDAAALNFFHLGNNPHFHLEIFQVARAMSGVIILHDCRLDLLLDNVFNHSSAGEASTYHDQLDRYYGLGGRQAIRAYEAGMVPLEYLQEQFTLLPFALEGSVGVVVHSDNALEQVRRFGKRCVQLQLPWPEISKAPKRNQSAPPYKLIVFGHLGHNRCLDKILDALAGLENRQEFRLNIYGEVSNKGELESWLDRFQVRNLVQMHGFVDDAVLDHALSEADLAINLRYPTMGEASASQLRIWAQGLATVVTRVGWYSEIPEEAVLFVHPGNEVQELREHLRGLARDPTRFVQMGEKGWHLLQLRHSSRAYVDQLIAYAQEVS